MPSAQPVFSPHLRKMTIALPNMPIWSGTAWRRSPRTGLSGLELQTSDILALRDFRQFPLGSAAPNVVAELLALARFRPNAVHLPPLAMLAASPRAPGASSFMVHLRSPTSPASAYAC